LLLSTGWKAPTSIAERPSIQPIDGKKPAISLLDETTWVDLAPMPADLPALPAEPVLTASEDHAAADRGQPLGRSLAPRIAIAAETRAPAADGGKGPGRALDPAFRRDTSSLHARLTDGSSRYQPEHERTSRTASSPDAIRKEKRIGIGDSSRTRHQAVPQAQSASTQASAEGEDDTRGGQSVEAPQRIDGRDSVRGEGAIDAEPGDRSFDNPELGPARDSRWVRAASDEKHPSLMDLSAVSAPGPSEGKAGRGPGEQPGVLDRAASGTAPTLAGDDALAIGRDSSRSAAELVRSRYEMEIRRRIARALRFPKRLALMLEQGESIVTFTVGPDGRVLGRIQLQKSAGFEEFDAEAMAAVARAAPFPATGRTQAVSMRVPFENPVVR
ncbi:MAG TPA: TonB family protein, partial [Polyangia bacterium]